jgi:type VI secretion system protein ImpA
LDCDRIIESISSSDKCGENLRYSDSFKSLYFDLKDKRNFARNEERALPEDAEGGNSDETVRLSSYWEEVNNLGLNILYSKSKDIEVLAWLCEAQLRLHGFNGLKNVLAAISSLLKSSWDELHSVGDETFEDKLAPLAGLNGLGGEGTLIQPLRLAPLVPGFRFGNFSLWSYQLSQRAGETRMREELQQACDAAGVSAMAEHLDIVDQSVAALDDIAATLEDRCGREAPSMSNIRNLLLESAAAIRDLAGLTTSEEPSEAAANGAEAPDPEHRDRDGCREDVVRLSGQVLSRQIGSREEAFELLLAVARYFSRTEPHSPMSLALETLVRRGRMDFSALLAELLPQADMRKSVLTAAGIQPEQETQNG